MDWTGKQRDTSTETEFNDDTEPTRKARRPTRPRVAQEVCAEAGIDAEAETAAARTMADTKARAKNRTAIVGEAAVEGRRVMSTIGASYLEAKAVTRNSRKC